MAAVNVEFAPARYLIFVEIVAKKASVVFTAKKPTITIEKKE
jgi:hypothetical protein